MADLEGNCEWTCNDCGQGYLVPATLFLQLEGDGLATCPECAEADDADGVT